MATSGDPSGNNRVVWVLTHPSVLVEPAVPVTSWRLNAQGRRLAERVAGGTFLHRVTSVWSSAETKAVELADLLARPHGIRRLVEDRLGENDRSATGFVPPEEFELLADALFADPDASVRGWASARTEQIRIVSAVEGMLLDERSGPGDVVLCGHGGVGTLLLCHLMGRPIDRRLDQPGQGHYFTFDTATRTVAHGWRPLMELAPPGV